MALSFFKSPEELRDERAKLIGGVKNIFVNIQTGRKALKKKVSLFMDLPTKERIQEERQQTLVPKELKKIQTQRSRERDFPLVQVGEDSFVDPIGAIGALRKVGLGVASKALRTGAREVFRSAEKLSGKIVKKSAKQKAVVPIDYFKDLSKFPHDSANLVTEVLDEGSEKLFRQIVPKKEAFKAFEDAFDDVAYTKGYEAARQNRILTSLEDNNFIYKNWTEVPENLTVYRGALKGQKIDGDFINVTFDKNVAEEFAGKNGEITTYTIQKNNIRWVNQGFLSGNESEVIVEPHSLQKLSNIVKKKTPEIFTGIKDSFKIHPDGFVEFFDDGMKIFSQKVDDLKYIQEANKANLDEVLTLFDRSKGRVYNEVQLKSLKNSYPENFNPDGTITLFRGGPIREGVNSYTFSKADAEGFGNFGFGSARGTGGSLNEVTVKPKDIRAIINGEEVLTSKVQTLFTGTKDLSTRLLEEFRGLPASIKTGRFNEIINKAKKSGIKQADEDLVRASAVIENGKVNLTKTGQKIEEQLVPLTPTRVINPPPENKVGKQFLMEGEYVETVFQSPVKNSAGDIHYGVPGVYDEAAGATAYPIKEGQESFPNYFGHNRKVILPDGKGVQYLEWQSDLMQKGRFTDESVRIKTEGDSLYGSAVDELERIMDAGPTTQIDITDAYINSQYKRFFTSSERKDFNKLLKEGEDPGAESVLKRVQEGLRKEFGKTESSLKSLEVYNSNDPLAQLRIFRDDLKRQAQQGKEYILTPKGKTAMKIEGLGTETNFVRKEIGESGFSTTLTKENMKVGDEILQSGFDAMRDGPREEAVNVITEVLGEGKFKTASKNEAERWLKITAQRQLSKEGIELGIPQYDTLLQEQQAEIFKSDYSHLPDVLSEVRDISGTIDKKHFVYKLNETAIPEEARKLGLKITDHHHSWRGASRGEFWRIDGIQSLKDKPSLALGSAQIGTLLKTTGAIGAGLGIGFGASQVAEKTSFGESKPETFARKERFQTSEKTFTEPFIGTNYDPLDPSQTRPDSAPEDIGKGSALVMMTEDMVAVPRRQGTIDQEKLVIPYGSVIYVPQFDRKFLVADTMKKKYNGQSKIDFVTLGKGKQIDPKFNIDLDDVVLVKKGEGTKKSVRDFVKSGEWKKELELPFKTRNFEKVK